MAARGFKKQLVRELERDLKLKHQKRMKELREQQRRLKVERKERLKQAKRSCNIRVRQSADKAQAEFKKARAAALKAQKAATLARNEARKVRKQSARDRCKLDRSAIVAESKAKLDIKRQEAEELRRYRRELEAGERLIRGRAAKPTPAQKRGRRGEKRSESDDLVRHNIEPRLRPLWEKRKRYTKADKHRSRTEVFNDWVHDNPEAVAELQHEQQPTSKDWAAAEAAYHAGRGRLEDKVPF